MLGGQYGEGRSELYLHPLIHSAGIALGTRYSSVKYLQALLEVRGVARSVLLDGFLVNALSHDTAQLKVRKLLTADLNAFASLGITPRVGLILFHFETSKATNFNPSPLGQGISHAVKEGINTDLSISYCDAKFFCKCFNQLSFVH